VTWYHQWVRSEPDQPSHFLCYDSLTTLSFCIVPFHVLLRQFLIPSVNSDPDAPPPQPAVPALANVALYVSTTTTTVIAQIAASRKNLVHDLPTRQQQIAALLDGLSANLPATPASSNRRKVDSAIVVALVGVGSQFTSPGRRWILE
jgi:hypothetical protein